MTIPHFIVSQTRGDKEPTLHSAPIFSLIFFVSNWVHDDIPPKDYAFREDSNTKTPLL
jgi:hypothetical protein